MATKPKKELPPLPATLPDGSVDCDPELPDPFVDLVKDPIERVRTWEEQQIERTKHLINTPDHVLALERQRQGEIEHARALAQVRTEGSAQKPPTHTPKAPKLREWKGTVTALALKVKQAWDKKPEGTLNSAFVRASKIWIRPDGRAFSSRSLAQSAFYDREYRKKGRLPGSR